MEIPQKTKNKTTTGPTNPLLGMYSKKTLIQKDTYICVFITALITIAKIWKQPICQLMDGYRSCDTYIQWKKCYSAVKRTKYCSNMDEPRDYHTK